MKQKSYISYTFLTIYEAAVYTMFYGIVMCGNLIGVFNSGFGLKSRFLAWLICDVSGIIIGLIFLLANKVILSFLYVFKEVNDKLKDLQETCNLMLTKESVSDTEAVSRAIKNQLSDKAVSSQIIIAPKNKWICPTCGKKNPAMLKTCKYCFHVPQTDFPSYEKSSLTWDCPECGNHNPYNNFSCRICNYTYRNSL
jgi:predicted RNA-binding Zn-ribbon protein involved in translation (DUF1610 family)